MTGNGWLRSRLALGASFLRLIAAVTPVPETELRATLDRLAAAELMFSRSTPPDASYTFKHALLRDAAYESLLKAQRQQLHASIADVLAAEFPEAKRWAKASMRSWRGLRRDGRSSTPRALGPFDVAVELALQRFVLPTVLKADDVVGSDRLVDRHRRIMLLGLLRRLCHILRAS